MITLGVAQAGLGEPALGMDNLRRGLALAQAAGASREIARAYLNINYALWSRGYVGEAFAIAQDAIRHARSQGAEWTWGVPLTAAVGELLYDLGRWHEAESMFHQASERRASTTAEIDFRRSLAQLRIGQGRLPEARAEIARLDGLTGALDLPEHATWEGFLHASLATWSGDWRGVRGAVDAALDQMAADDLPFDGPRLAALAIRADAELVFIAESQHDGQRAEAIRAASAATLARVDEVTRLPGARDNRRLDAHVALAHAEATRVSGASDPNAWQRVAAAFERIPMPFEATYATMRRAEALLAGRDRAGSTAALRIAFQTATRLGAERLAAEIHGLAARARISLETAPVTAPDGEPDRVNPFGLTSRELEVLALLSEGRTNRQIAAQLFVTVKTASLHVSNILAKLEVANRVEAAGMAHRLGLAPEPTAPA